MRLLDLFCGAGGAAVGYHRAGFDEIVGVDNRPQPRYPFTFVLGDALEYCAEHGHEYDAIHASPPCQGYSIMHNLPWLKGREYPLLILPTFELLESLDKPYVIENVMGAKHGAKGLTKRGLEAHGLQAGYLCGTMFGLPFYRHRLFATNFLWLAPGHPKHRSNGYSPKDADGKSIVGPGNRGKGSGMIIRQPFKPNQDIHQSCSVRAASPTLANWQNHPGDGVGIGHAKGWKLAAEAMGIDWMTRDELTQAIPSAYTCWIGKYLMQAVKR